MSRLLVPDSGPLFSCLLSTQAFLEYAESKKWIPSAEQARQATLQNRPGAYTVSQTILNVPDPD